MDYGIALGLLLGAFVLSFPFVRKTWYICKVCGAKGGHGEWWLEGENQITYEKLQCKYCSHIQVAYKWEDQ